jgi:hypothetical protein
MSGLNPDTHAAKRHNQTNLGRDPQVDARVATAGLRPGLHVSQHHLRHATKREYQKLGRRLDDALFRR